jgi:hypothetical protein
MSTTLIIGGTWDSDGNRLAQSGKGLEKYENREETTGVFSPRARFQIKAIDRAQRIRKAV